MEAPGCRQIGVYGRSAEALIGARLQDIGVVLLIVETPT
jgi:hypothetical protein